MELCSSSAKVEEVENSAGPNWLELPRDVTAKILNNLPFMDLMSARLVCPLWWNICKDPFMWRSISMSTLDPQPLDDWNQPEMCYLDLCYLAIDQSRGHLQDINIEYFGSDNLLKYVANSTSQLRRLRFRYCVLSDEAVRDVANKLPLLEELEVKVSGLSANTIEIIGRCCPLMTTLKLQWCDVYEVVRNDDEAFAIAKNMPKLCHLELTDNMLTRNGLRAILDGCNHLESVLLRNCENVTLRESLGKSTFIIQSVRFYDWLEISDLELMEFVEELDLSLNAESSDCLELIGRSCPYLTNLKFMNGSVFKENDNSYVFAVAKTMPKLRHLRIFGNSLSNDGLLAILDGCNKLETLDLGSCHNTDFEPSLVKRCHQQIRVVNFLCESDYEDEYTSWIGLKRKGYIT